MGSTLKFARAPLGIAILLGASLTLGGCAPEPGTPNTDAPASDQSSSNGATENPPADDSGPKDLVDDEGIVPDWFPGEFPLYPGSVSAGFGEVADKTMISFSVPGSDEETIFQWFVEQYSQNGWEAHNLDEVSSDFDAINADGREAYINVTKGTYVISASRG